MAEAVAATTSMHQQSQDPLAWRSFGHRIGPTPEYMINFGAKVTKCMREDRGVTQETNRVRKMECGVPNGGAHRTEDFYTAWRSSAKGDMKRETSPLTDDCEEGQLGISYVTWTSRGTVGLPLRFCGFAVYPPLLLLTNSIKSGVARSRIELENCAWE